MGDKNQIVVRDRRKPKHYRIDNVVLDEWLPIIGPVGYALYSMYTRMADNNEERSWPGYQLLEGHLDIASGTVANYNRLLVWCGLIHVEQGDPARNRSNDYYILEPMPVTPQGLREVYTKATEHHKPDDWFFDALVKRIDNWRPLQSYFPPTPPRPQVIHRDVSPTHTGEQATHARERATHIREQATHIREQATHNDEYPTHVGRVEQHPIQNKETSLNNKEKEQTTNNNMSGWLSVTSIFERLGIADPVRSRFAEKTEWPFALALAWWCVTADWSDNPAGLAVKRLQRGEFPPESFFELVEFITSPDVDLVAFRQAARIDERALHDFGLTNGAAKAAAAIYKKDSSWFELEAE